MTRIVLAALLALATTPSFAMDLTSSDVTDGKTFDTKFICPKYSGTSTSPALSWSGVPADAKSLALTMFDPDAGTKGHWHWLLTDVPTSTTTLAQGAASTGGKLPAGTPLPNGAGHSVYDGPCPPVGKPHHYEITLYALPDAKFDAAAAVTASDNTNELKAAAIGAALAKDALATARITPIYENK